MYARAILSLLMAVSVAVLMASAPVRGEPYRTAKDLFQDCASGTGGQTLAAKAKLQPCSKYISAVFNDWNLDLDKGVCSTHVGGELAPAYVAYWQARGTGALAGRLTSARTSVVEFLDTQKGACPAPDPKTTPQ
jgi:hypothetical protein